MYCQRCGKPVVHVLSFEGGKCKEFYRCHACWMETKKKHFAFRLNSFQTGIRKKEVNVLRICNNDKANQKARKRRPASGGDNLRKRHHR